MEKETLRPIAIAIGENGDLVLTKCFHRTSSYDKTGYFNFSLIYGGNIEYSDENVATEIAPKRIWVNKDDAEQLRDALTELLKAGDTHA